MKNFGAITATTLLHDLSSYQCQLMLNVSYSINSKTKLKLSYGVERAFGKIITMQYDPATIQFSRELYGGSTGERESNSTPEN